MFNISHFSYLAVITELAYPDIWEPKQLQLCCPEITAIYSNLCVSSYSYIGSCFVTLHSKMYTEKHNSGEVESYEVSLLYLWHERIISSLD